jgi:hypothetical protein
MALAGVNPEAFDQPVSQFTPLQIGVVDISDLKLAPARWFQGFDNIKDIWWVHIDSNDGEVRRWLFGFFDDLEDLVPLQLSDAIF